MKKYSVFLITLFITVCFYNVLLLNYSNKSSSLLNLVQESYKKCVDDLSFIRKKHPDVQPKTYRVIDQLDKMHFAVKELGKKEKTKKVAYKNLKTKYDEQVLQIKDLCKIRDVDNVALQNEVSAHKSVLDVIQKRLIDKTKELQDKEEVIKQLEQKVTTLTNLENEKKLEGEIEENKNKAKKCDQKEKGATQVSKVLAGKEGPKDKLIRYP